MSTPPRRSARARLLGLAMMAALAACSDISGPRPDLVPEPSRWNALGLVEVTLSDLDAPQPRAEARSVAAGAQAREGGARFSLSKPAGSGVSTDGTIQLQALSTGSFTSGTRGAGGVRYVYSTFRVRNATSPTASVPSQPYPTPRTNLTFVAVATGGTLGGTAVSRLSRYNGTAAGSEIATQVMPTGAVTQNADGTVAPRFPDVLQAFEESEVADIPLSPGATALPYGFVARNAADLTRTLPAGPAAGQWDGLVTFAFRLPLQAAATDDPFTVTFTFVAVDDRETRVTQSAEEQTPAGAAAAMARAQQVGGTLTALGLDSSAVSQRRVCSVRTAGPAGAPAATLFPAAHGGFVALTHAADGGFRATFRCPPAAAPGAGNFAVHGAQGGRAFLAGGYTGAGTRTLSTPAGGFFAGEEVEVSLTAGLGAGLPYVARHRAPSGSASLRFTQEAALALSSRPAALLPADVNGDGVLDVVAVGGSGVRAFLGSGFGSPAAEGPLSLPGADLRVAAAGDLNGDGRPDLVVGDAVGGAVRVLLRAGSGGFVAGPPVATDGAPSSVALGDLNGDGRVDAVAGSAATERVTVLLGDGAGGLSAAGTAAAGGLVALGDVNGDGHLDLAAAGTGFSDNLRVLFGNGTGAYTPERRWTAGVTRTATALGLTDLDGDGRPELTLLDGAADDVLVLRNEGGTLEGTAQRWSLGGSPVALAFADLNGNGSTDVVVSTDGGVYWVDRQTSFSSSAAALSLPASTAGQAAVGDLDGDGRVDLAVERAGAPGLLWLTNF